MPALYKKFDNWDLGVINAREATSLPANAVYKSQNMYWRDGRWRKVPGLVEKNKTQIGTEGVWSIFKFYQPLDDKISLMAASGESLYKFDEGAESFTEIESGMFPNQPVGFIEHLGKLYFGSTKDLWRRYDGGLETYKVGLSEPPKKFPQIIFNEFAGRFFGVFEDGLYWSNHIDEGGIERWPDGNVQIFTPVRGGFPLHVETFEGRITIFSKLAINSGTVVGPPESWSFEREKAQTGYIAPRTIKRWGNNFFGLTPSFEVYSWPSDQFITKDRIKFAINPEFAKFACAEIVEDRYYYLSFRSTNVRGTSFETSVAIHTLLGAPVSPPIYGLTTPTKLEDQYHLWIYDILADRWYGPHVQYSITSMYWDADNNILLCGGIDEFAGFVMEHRGKDIKNNASKIQWVGPFSDFDAPRIDKRFSKIWLRAKHEGVKPGGEGQVYLRVYVDGGYGNPQSQLVPLVDTSTPDNLIRDTASSTRELIIKRGHIHEQYGRGTNALVELLHEYPKGDFEFSDFQMEYFLKYGKENRRT